MRVPKPRKKRESPKMEFYAETAGMMSRAVKTVRNDMASTNSMADAMGEDFLATLADTKFDTTRGHALIVRLRKAHSREAVAAFVEEYKHVGIPKQFALPADTPVGIVTRQLKHLTPEDRDQLLKVLLVMRQHDRDKTSK